MVLGAVAAVRAEYQRHRHTPGVDSGRHIDGSAQALGKRGYDSVALPTSPVPGPLHKNTLAIRAMST